MIPDKIWIEAKKKFRLSDRHIQMAKELGMNPKKFGSLANHKQEPWKLPLPEFIEDLYERRFGKSRPDCVISLEEHIRKIEQKKRECKERN